MNNAHTVTDVEIVFHQDGDAGYEVAADTLEEMAKQLREEGLNAKKLYRGTRGNKVGGLTFRGVHQCDYGHLTTSHVKLFPMEEGAAPLRLCRDHFSEARRERMRDENPDAVPTWDEAEYLEGTQVGHPVETRPKQDTPTGKWYAVPGYNRGSGPLTDPHLVNSDGELVATFEELPDAEHVARLHNRLEGHDG